MVKDIIPDSKIEIEWGAPGKERIRVEWTFEPMDAQSTFVRIVTDGFTGDEKAYLL